MKNAYVIIYANEVTNVFTDDVIESIDMFEIELPTKILLNCQFKFFSYKEIKYIYYILNNILYLLIFMIK